MYTVLQYLTFKNAVWVADLNFINHYSVNLVWERTEFPATSDMVLKHTSAILYLIYRWSSILNIKNYKNIKKSKSLCPAVSNDQLRFLYVKSISISISLLCTFVFLFNKWWNYGLYCSVPHISMFGSHMYFLNQYRRLMNGTMFTSTGSFSTQDCQPWFYMEEIGWWPQVHTLLWATRVWSTQHLGLVSDLIVPSTVGLLMALDRGWQAAYIESWAAGFGCIVLWAAVFRCTKCFELLAAVHIALWAAFHLHSALRFWPLRTSDYWLLVHIVPWIASF